MTPVDVSGLTVDVCQGGCAGIWFDRAELRALGEPATKAGDVLVALAGTPAVTVDVSPRRRCPVCPNSVLMRHFHSVKRAVSVDECPTCAGMWLDGGELERIRREYDSAGDRSQGVRSLAEQMLAIDRLALVRKRLGDELPYDTSRSRIVSSLLVAFYLLLASSFGGSLLTMRVVGWSVVPWACVCFPDVLGAAARLGTRRASPRFFVWLLGWVVLLLPLIQLAIVWAGTSGFRR